MRIDMVALADLVLDPRNAREHDRRNIDEIKRSLQAFGQHAPLVVQRSTNRVLIGNGRLQAMRELGWTEAAVFFVNDDDKTAIRRALTDNRTSDLSAWNDDVLRELLEEIGAIDVPGWSQDEIDELLGVDKEPEDDEFDPTEHLPDVPITAPGDMIILGGHRLVCGDSTNPDVVTKLMDGATASLVLTDPPYNVDYGDKVEHMQRYDSGGERDNSTIANDRMSEGRFYEFLKAAFEAAYSVCAPGAVIYVFHSEREGLNFRMALRDAGWSQRQTLIWVKQAIVMGRQDYQWQHEPILYGWKTGAPHYFTNDRTHSTVFDDARPADFKKMKKDELVELVRQLYEER